MRRAVTAGVAFSLLPFAAHAQGHLSVNTGVSLTFTQIFSNIVSVAAAVIGGLAVTVFLFGAFKMTLFAAREDAAKSGKTIMIEALKGLAIVLFSYALIRIFYTFLYS